MPLNPGSASHLFAVTIWVTEPAKTASRLLILFSERKIFVEGFYLHSNHDQAAKIIISFRLEKGRIRRTVRLLGMMTGVVELEWLESKGSQ